MSKRTLSTHALAAKQIRTQLRQAFPHTKFRVRSEAFAGGDSVHVNWIDGPTSSQVEAIAQKHERGQFDGMRDIYEDTNRRDDIPQTKYVICQRGMNDASRAAVTAATEERFGDTCANLDREYGFAWSQTKVWRAFSETSLVCPYCKHATEFPDRYCGDCGAPLGVDSAAPAIAEAERIIFAAQ